MALNLEEMVRAIISARAMAASIIKNEDLRGFHSQAMRVLSDLRPVEEQLSMMRDMFAPSPPEDD